MAAIELTEERIDSLTDLETIELAHSTGLLLDDEVGLPALIRIRLKRALQ